MIASRSVFVPRQLALSWACAPLGVPAFSADARATAEIPSDNENNGEETEDQDVEHGLDIGVPMCPWSNC